VYIFKTGSLEIAMQHTIIVTERDPLCCSVLQCVAVCCSVLQCVAVCCSVLQFVAVCCSVWQCVALCCSVVQCVAARRLLSRESSHVTNNEPCHTYSESWHTLKRVVSRRGIGTNLFDLLQEPFMNESCHTFE